MNTASCPRNGLSFGTTSNTFLRGDELENLALAGQRCSLHKGTNIASIDPRTGAMVSLFNPRRDRWADHFHLMESRIAGTTAVGRATAQLLDMNDTRRVELHAELIAAGRFLGR